MSNPDFQQALRDLAQAEQMRSAGESARNSRKLLEAQEKQAELEEQKLKIEQIRLHEERERHQALAKKAETQKTIRVAMAGVEEELDLLLRRANSTQESELVDGLSPLSFLAVLAEKKLNIVIQSEGQLEDLGDIRFVRSLRQKFHEITERHPSHFGEGILQRALETLRKVAFWAQETKCFNDQDISLPAFLNESDSKIQLTEKFIIEALQLNSERLELFLESIEQIKQKTLIACEKITEAWDIRDGLVSKLRGYGIGDAELRFISNSELDPSSEDLLERARRHQSRVEELCASLMQAKADWIHDRNLLESAKTSLLEAKFGEAEKASKQFKRLTWTDLDLSGIDKALTEKRESLLKEVEVLASDKLAAINLAERLSTEYSSSPAIANPIKNYSANLMRELVSQKMRRRQDITLVGLLIGGLTAGGIWLIGQHRDKMARIEKERLLATERVSRAIANGKALIDEARHVLLLIPQGSFNMTSKQEDYARPVRTVSVSAFFIGQTEVTYEEWKTVLAWGKSKGYEFGLEGQGASESHPVTNLSWYDAVKWCNAKSEKEGLTICYKLRTGVYRRGQESGVECDWDANGYRLPTEAEWEKAARGGLEGKTFPNGDLLHEEDANFNGSRTTEVITYPPNGYGLYDMAGNAYEWCWDWYGTSPEGEANDPKGPSSGKFKVTRGGDARCSGRDCRVSSRSAVGPDHSMYFGGFRLVRNLDLRAQEKRAEQP
jgi:sulfatase modifying factor 1